jgi:putative tryptophan/tyrosine transport system substrate-binding protein
MTTYIGRRRIMAMLGGAMAAWPLAARAQQPAMPAIGYLDQSDNNPFIAALRQGLGEQGYVDGRNVEILYRSADAQYDRLPALAADLVGRRVAVIVSRGGTASQAATAATSTIPIVFVTGGDPVELSLVVSLNRPGGNTTGASFLTSELTAKRLELLHEIVPAATLIGFLVNPTNAVDEADRREAEIAARILGVRLVIANASTAGEIEAAFAILVEERIGALLIAGDPLFTKGHQVVALAARHAVPAIYETRGNVEAGGLMSYGARATDISDLHRLTGTYTGRILKGEKPANLPVQRSTRTEMVLNLKTAKTLGIEVPTSILLRADEVIEADR